MDIARSRKNVSRPTSQHPVHPEAPLSNLQSLFTYLYGKIRPIPSFLEYPRGESQISTWIFFIFHVGVIQFLRSFI